MPPLSVAAVLLAASPALAQTTRLMSHTPAGVPGDGLSMLASISGDGRYVAFQSHADDLIAGDLNGCEDIFRGDSWTGRVELVSISLAGTTGNRPSRQSQVSRDGRFVCFQSYASDLVPGDTNGVSDIFVRDMQLGLTTRVSVSSTGAQSDGGSRYAYISQDGRFVAFESQATNLVAGDTNGLKDVFLHDLLLGTTERVEDGPDGDARRRDRSRAVQIELASLAIGVAVGIVAFVLPL